jgi:hypothetical protein
MKRKLARLGVVFGAAAGLMTMAAPAMATGPTGNDVSGFDESPDVVITQGSDTSYFVTNLFSNLYNQSPGCRTNNSVVLNDVCVPGQAGPGAGVYANWDHDVIANAFPIGSGSGRNQLDTPANVKNPGDIARSSSGGGAATNSNWAFASEGVAVVAVNRTPTAGTSVSLAQLQAIYEDGNNICNSTVTWADLGDATGPAGLVLPFGMNSGSGTFGTFNTYIGGTANTGDCVTPTPYVPFENDVAHLRLPGAPGAPNGADGDAATEARYQTGQGIWWMSGATLTAFPIQSATLSPILLNGVNYTATSGYALRRTVSFVTRDVDAAFCTGAGVAGGGTAVNGCSAASSSANYLIGAATPSNVGGKPGAAREFVRYVCRLTRQEGDPNTQGQATAISYGTRVTGAIQQAGFSPTVSGANFGRCLGS